MADRFSQRISFYMEKMFGRQTAMKLQQKLRKLLRTLLFAFQSTIGKISMWLLDKEEVVKISELKNLQTGLKNMHLFSKTNQNILLVFSEENFGTIFLQIDFLN